jgi:hypothetical protein
LDCDEHGYGDTAIGTTFCRRGVSAPQTGATTTWAWQGVDHNPPDVLTFIVSFRQPVNRKDVILRANNTFLGPDVPDLGSLICTPGGRYADLFTHLISHTIIIT